MSNSEKIVEWFLGSRIYNGEAYLSFYSGKRKGPVYPEITAYAISLSCILYEKRQDKRFLVRAEKCAEYLRRIGRNGAIPCLEDDLLYTFDTGIYISGVCDLFNLTGNEIYLSDAERSLDWLYALWSRKRFAAVDRIPDNKDWYHLPSVHLLKLIIPLMKASNLLGNKKYEKTALELLEEFKKLQTDDGGFRVYEGSDRIMTHPHCYAIEGLLFAYHVLRNQEALDLAKKSSEWLSKKQNTDGSFYRRYDAETSEENERRSESLRTSDATAQATRIWKLLGVNQDGVNRAYEYLNSQLKDGGLTLFKNATLAGRLLSWRRAIFSWPTFFYLHSLQLPFGRIEYCRELF